jgi:hypothetical protein
MKNKPLTFLLSLTFLFLFSGSVYGDDYEDGIDGYKRQDHIEVLRFWLPLTEQGYADAKHNLEFLYKKTQMNN